MKELTIITTAQITDIVEVDDEVNELEYAASYESESAMKAALDADDVVVDSVKVFITKDDDDEQIDSVE